MSFSESSPASFAVSEITKWWTVLSGYLIISLQMRQYAFMIILVIAIEFHWAELNCKVKWLSHRFIMECFCSEGVITQEDELCGVLCLALNEAVLPIRCWIGKRAWFIFESCNQITASTLFPTVLSLRPSGSPLPCNYIQAGPINPYERRMLGNWIILQREMS